jgi:hypothetical protein
MVTDDLTTAMKYRPTSTWWPGSDDAHSGSAMNGRKKYLRSDDLDP